MALQSATLEEMIVSNLEGAGFDSGGEHSQINVLANAIAKAVVEHIQTQAEVTVSAGSSAGSYAVV